MTKQSKPLVICAPEPRSLDLIFTPEKLSELRARYELHETEADAVAGLGEALLANTRYVLGQPPIPSEALAKMSSLKAVFNVESNLLDNMPYEEIFNRGIYVLTTGSVFAVPVAEIGLGFALDLARQISQADADFRSGRELWGGDGNSSARLLTEADIGLIGFGDIGRALHRLLVGFRCNVRVFDPWLPNSVLEDHQVIPADLIEVLTESDFVFVLAAATTENRGLIGEEEFAAMRPSAAFILLSRADVVDFEAMLDAIERNHIIAASDVWPDEPLPFDHRGRSLHGLIKSAHRAGAIDTAFKKMGDMVLEDMALIDQGLPPIRCKRAERETAGRMRSKPVARN
ncbi:hydroxyacid dehydrogenase [Ruegeria arenilitoris]|uniref:hydroxyacid dehydrogenase n=1 Tax=Ruegeria arenilitoris TaxID=1173585 RepID=UPI00147C53FF